jgi:hypothetical protein
MVSFCVCCAWARGAICSAFDQFHLRSKHIMNEIHVIARLGQALLAISMTLATALVFLS